MPDSTPTRLRIGGVPEHFNLPWHLAREHEQFKQAGIDLQWHECPGGTGEMRQLIEAGELDLVVALSEGAVAAIADGCPMRILQWYVRTPLIWGVHVPTASPLHSIADLRGQRFAISRPGSGSHLMAAVMAEQQGWSSSELEFVTVGNLDGAVEAFSKDQADGFLWERYTTQPLVDRGHMRRIGECPTPWPAFVLCAHHNALERQPKAIAALQTVIVDACQALGAEPDLEKLIAERYGLEISQVNHWLERTRWAVDQQVEANALDEVIASLRHIGLIKRPITGRDCLARPV